MTFTEFFSTVSADESCSVVLCKENSIGVDVYSWTLIDMKNEHTLDSKISNGQIATSQDSVEVFTHIIFDLASVKFSAIGSTMTVSTQLGEFLGTGFLGVNGEREACLAALDDAAANTRLVRDTAQLKVAFYDPHTAKIAVGPSFACKTYHASTPVSVSVAGTPCVVTGDILTTDSNDVASFLPQPSLRELSRAMASVRNVS